MLKITFKSGRVSPTRFIPISFFLMAAIAGCASGPQKVDYSAGTDVHAKLGELQSRLDQDREKQYDQLSPSRFEAAQTALNDAQKMMNHGDSAQDVLERAGVAEANLRLVEENAVHFSSAVAPVLSARHAALDAKARIATPRELADADDDFRSFGKDIEKNDFHPKAEAISKLEEKYSRLELLAVKMTVLREPRDAIAGAKDHGAEKKTPDTYKEAQMRYDTALRTIEAHRRDPAAYQDAVNESKRSAAKLQAVLSTVDTDKASEMAAVRIYDQHNALVTDQKVIAQTRAEVRDTEDQVTQAKERLTAEQQGAADLRAKNQQYTDQAQLDQKIADARNEFAPDEAEVARDGNKIILRLKKMNFASGRSDLPADSLSTLKKVKDMLAIVPISKVTVEGHTDAVGGEKKNLALSQKRADAVRQFLLSEKAVSSNINVEAQGFGDQRPLTTNKTAEGRKTNRRVDVVIETTSTI